MEKINLKEKFATFHEHWTPKIVGDVGDCHIKLAKLKGEFVWHLHENEDEMFLVVKGNLRIKLRDGDVTVHEGEFVVVPRGVEHLPIADREAHVLLVEPRSTINTGDVVNDRTIRRPDRI
ncbi:MAG: cupin domain-containing protein [Planctomycetes bacterium]|nr:cupin domain-containing protein [Planctomycetota bacterium]